jgi:hypothetical protein
MPCYDGIRDAYQNKAIEEGNEAIKLLCALCRSSSVETIASIEGLEDWWLEHRIIDALNDFYKANRGKGYPMESLLSSALSWGNMRDFIKEHSVWCQAVYHQAQTKDEQ